MTDCLFDYIQNTHTNIQLSWFEYSLVSPRYSKQSLTTYSITVYRYGNFVWEKMKTGCLVGEKGFCVAQFYKLSREN